MRIKALDRDGKPYELIAEGLLAVCIQHECDHLNGKLFVDYLSSLKRDRIRRSWKDPPPAGLIPEPQRLATASLFLNESP